MIVTNCSSRKTVAPVPTLRARSLPRGTAPDLAGEWRARQRTADGRIAARNLYAGRGFSLAADVARSSGSELRIVSAGMGLIRPDTVVAPYSLTLSAGSPDCVLRRAAPSTPFSAQEWWQAIRSPLPGTSPFRRLLAARPRSLFVLALTQPYLNMVAAELQGLADQDRLRVLGLSNPHSLPEHLRGCVMPYDRRLNDVNRPVRGTTFDFPVRALQHFVELVKGDRRIDSASAHARRVRQALAHWEEPVASMRRRIDDAALRREIKKLKSQNLSRSAGLRHLRQERGIACEQDRFALAWN